MSVMKKIIISLVLLIPLLTGCTNINAKLTINKDDSASIEAVANYKGDLFGDKSYETITILNNYQKFLDDNYVVYKKEGSPSSIYARKRVKNIRYSDLDLSSLGFVTNLPSGRFVDVKKNLFAKLYKIDMSYDYNKQQNKVAFADEKDLNKSVGGLVPEYYQKYAQEESEETANPNEEKDDFLSNMDESIFFLEDDSSTDDIQEQDDEFDAVFSVKLPYFAAYSNADISKGMDTYIWRIKKDGVTNIKLQYIVYNGWSIAFLILLFILLLLYLAKRILRHDAQKRIGSEN